MIGRPIALVGPTAVGKSAIALELVRRLGPVEIVSVDSMQVYRGMDIGTAKASRAERSRVRHHLIDLVDPDADFTVARFQQAYRDVRADLERRQVRPLLVGGTGLYHRAVIDDLDIPGRYPEVVADLETEPMSEVLHHRLAEVDPVAASRMEPSNRRRVVRALEVCLGSGRPFSSFGPGLDAYPDNAIVQIGLDRDRADLDARIAARYRQQLADGFLGEVERLAARPAGLSRTARQALGYRELLEVVGGRARLDEALDTAIARTRRFARRQQRWFRRDPRVRWISLGVDDNPVAVVDRVLGDCGACI